MPEGVEEKIIECRIAAAASRLRLLRCVIKDTAQYIGIDDSLCGNLVLAVNEACMNIIQHAYKNEPDREIHLTIIRNQKGIVFNLQDDAPCVDLSRIKSRNLSNIRPGGLGVHFMKKIMDEVEYGECSGRGNTLTLIKYI